MQLLSKNDPLEVSITNMKNTLASVGCEITFSQEKHPLTHCYSVNLASTEAPRHIYSNGKGVVSEASIASALGEYIERLQTNNFFIDFHLPGRKYYPDEIAFDLDGDYLSEDLRNIYDPSRTLCADDLIDFNSDYEDKVVALPFVRVSCGTTSYIPINILSNLYVSNGLASGNTPKEAQVQALSEIFERYVKFEIIKNGYALPKFPNEVIESFPRLAADLAHLRALGYIVEVLDASLGGTFPVTAISLINPQNASLFVSFGAHPILEVSLERTMTELMQGRNIEELDSFETPTFDMSLIADSFNLESHFIDSNGKLGFAFLRNKKTFEYTPWNYQGDSSDEEYSYLCSILTMIDKEIYLREYDYLGFYSCQMIVPGLSEVYPIEDLIYNNKNQGKLIRQQVLHFKDYEPEEILCSIEALEDTLNIEKYIGVIFANNFTMIELKAQLHILLGETQEAIDLLEYSADPLAPVLLELLKMQSAEALYEEYEEALFAIFTESKVRRARAILEHKEYLIDTRLHDDYLGMLGMYDKLENKKGSLVA